MFLNTKKSAASLTWGLAAQGLRASEVRAWPRAHAVVHEELIRASAEGVLLHAQAQGRVVIALGELGGERDI